MDKSPTSDPAYNCFKIKKHMDKSLTSDRNYNYVIIKKHSYKSGTLHLEVSDRWDDVLFYPGSENIFVNVRISFSDGILYFTGTQLQYYFPLDIYDFDEEKCDSNELQNKEIKYFHPHVKNGKIVFYKKKKVKVLKQENWTLLKDTKQISFATNTYYISGMVN